MLAKKPKCDKKSLAVWNSSHAFGGWHSNSGCWGEAVSWEDLRSDSITAWFSINWESKLCSDRPCSKINDSRLGIDWSLKINLNY